MTQATETFISSVNGAKINVQDPLTAQLLSKNEKKDIIHKERQSAKADNATKQTKGGKPKNSADADGEQEIR